MTRKRTTLHSHSVKHLEDPKDRPQGIQRESTLPLD
ncbi:hypothetical protein BMYO_0045 [Bifidobacterium myosotis]|uniref:Uncharacterized protein n=1 Tax=Bifidobacterium myosotis TaxID=1630166 RepID=A0A261FQR5_9BIFI|nr:hypothetical protein BMYO_0045 [Bifidobacterium myosotis]